MMEHAAIYWHVIKLASARNIMPETQSRIFFFTKNRYDLTIIISKVHINLDMLSLNISFDFTIINVS